MCRKRGKTTCTLQHGHVEGCCGGGVMEAMLYNLVLYSLLGDGVIAIAGPRVVYTRFGKSLVTDLQLYLGFLRSILYIYSVDISANPQSP